MEDENPDQVYIESAGMRINPHRRKREPREINENPDQREEKPAPLRGRTSWGPIGGLEETR